MKQVVRLSVTHKCCYKAHLTSMECKEVQNSPFPVVTRWTSWYAAVLYPHILLEYYHPFLEQEEVRTSLPHPAILSLLDSPELAEQLIFVAENSEGLKNVLMSFTMSSVCVYEIYDRVHDLTA